MIILMIIMMIMIIIMINIIINDKKMTIIIICYERTITIIKIIMNCDLSTFKIKLEIIGC